MTDKQKRIMNYPTFRQSIDDEQNRTMNSHCQRLIPIAVDHLPTSTVISRKQRCSSTINEQSTYYPNNQHLIYDPNILPQATVPSRKRSVEDNSDVQDYHQHTNKRTRYDQSNCIESENQPPSSTIKRRSLFLYHPGQDRNHSQMPNEIPSLFSPLLSSVSAYHRMDNAPYHEYDQNLANNFSSCDSHTDHRTNQHLYMFGNDTLMNSTQKNTYPKSSKFTVNNNVRLLSPQSNVTTPLRTTNFVFDSKQQTMSATIMRTGNISPAHSDTSTESTSTCSSDEQQFHQHFPSFHYQPSRSYRERENYEQLLDLAEKLSDPNRFNKVNIEQFVSYRYKTITTIKGISSSKQTACVICMSHFKHNQHIRVLPCEHEYHSKCIARWFTMNSSCPICRRDNFLSTC